MEPTLMFYGGRLGAALPLQFFVIWAISISVAGAPSEYGLIVGMVGGLTLGMLLCRSRWGDYANAIFAGMANPVATVGTAVGTGYGTAVAFCTLMFPAGLATACRSG